MATESVLPVFDKTVAVRNRLVTTAGRAELGGGLGFNLIEGIYTNTVFHGTASYNFSEEKAVTLFMIMGSSELSNTGKDLKAGRGLSNNTFDATLAPSPEMFITGNYQFTAYYGKFSVSKQKAMNLALYGLAGGGLLTWSDGEMSPVLSAGVGQKFYFNPNFALRADLQMMVYQGPDITSKPLQVGTGKKDSSYFSDETFFRPFLNASLV
ncbi:MAG: outer membrane beta-barrel domain-containing protein, partial [Bdellovibrionota bacterium]